MRRYYSYNTVKEEEGRKKEKERRRKREREMNAVRFTHFVFEILIVPALVGLQISRINSLTARFAKIISL